VRVGVELLERVQDGKAEHFAFPLEETGRTPRRSPRWSARRGAEEAADTEGNALGRERGQFVRPVHGLVMLHGERIVPGSVLGIESGRATRGHRFQGERTIVLNNAGEYEQRLRDEGKVIASFGERRDDISRQLHEQALKLDAVLSDPAKPAR